MTEITKQNLHPGYPDLYYTIHDQTGDGYLFIIVQHQVDPYLHNVCLLRWNDVIQRKRDLRGMQVYYNPDNLVNIWRSPEVYVNVNYQLDDFLMDWNRYVSRMNEIVSNTNYPKII